MLWVIRVMRMLFWPKSNLPDCTWKRAVGSEGTFGPGLCDHKMGITKPWLYEQLMTLTFDEEVLSAERKRVLRKQGGSGLPMTLQLQARKFLDV